MNSLSCSISNCRGPPWLSLNDIYFLIYSTLFDSWLSSVVHSPASTLDLEWTKGLPGGWIQEIDRDCGHPPHPLSASFIPDPVENWAPPQNWWGGPVCLRMEPDQQGPYPSRE